MLNELSDLFFISHLPDEEEPELNWEGCIPYQTQCPDGTGAATKINLARTIFENDPVWQLLKAYCFGFGDKMAVIDGATVFDHSYVVSQSHYVRVAERGIPAQLATVRDEMKKAFDSLERAFYTGWSDAEAKRAMKRIMKVMLEIIKSLDNGWITTGNNPGNPQMWANLDQSIVRRIQNRGLATEPHCINLGFISSSIPGECAVF